MEWVIIYIVGYFAGYYTLRYYFKNHIYDTGSEKWSWKDVFLGTATSLGSWITVFVAIILLIAVNIKPPKSDPPKWL